MKRIFAALTFTCLLAVILSAQRPMTPADVFSQSCSNLTSLRLISATVNVSHVVRGTFRPAAGGDLTGLPAFCRVAMTLRPSSDSDIKSEVWLPMNDWNGKFQEVGNGAWGGSIQYA